MTGPTVTGPTVTGPTVTGPAETAGLGSAQQFAAAMTAAFAGQTGSTARFVEDLRTHGVDGAVVTAAEDAQRASDTAAAAWARADQVLTAHKQVGEAYAANPGAGDREFIVDDTASDSGPVMGMNAAGPAPSTDDEQLRADRRAKAEIIVPLVDLVLAVQNIAEARDRDDDADPDELLDTLIAQVRKATSAVGLGDAAQPGTTVGYEPGRHYVYGDVPDSDAQVQIASPGVTWRHGADELVLSHAGAYRHDDERGAHLVTEAGGGIDQEAEHEQALWLTDDSPQAADLECYTGPGWYVVESVIACDADELCTAETPQDCDGLQVSLYRDDDSQAQLVHYRADETVVIDCNEYELADSASEEPDEQPASAATGHA
ncbi:hypothetical protein ACFFX1_10695 [Dactylosporangium sucinum]|uniref:Uncharacterized protein n=1 Tax=Dactylosporangium sucinum TaxID=1424081 RepID=A0A917TH99_9ACTN|nr:hypothetical protein [Dactylosporangium sucinum]GGM23137.1 hypothetical protein GCM10007977_025450 [Dactylosporangium sucinum]